jgi:sugar-specific transcriptional regulator TrmB
MNDAATDIDTLKRAGLTESHAKGYLALTSYSSFTPPQLAHHIGETRTNGYAVADKLVGLGLAIKKDAKKTFYVPAHPSNLELLAEKRRRAVEKNEQIIKKSIPGLIELFYVNNEMPGSRTLTGIDGIKEVYNDTLRTKRDIYLLQTAADIDIMGKDYYSKHRAKRASLGINTYSLTPDEPNVRLHLEDDQSELIHRTLIPADAYTAPVEIGAYGDKIALVAFGETQMATIIDSPPIAEAFKQIVVIMQNAFKQP